MCHKWARWIPRVRIISTASHLSTIPTWCVTSGVAGSGIFAYASDHRLLQWLTLLGGSRYWVFDFEPSCNLVRNLIISRIPLLVVIRTELMMRTLQRRSAACNRTRRLSFIRLQQRDTLAATAQTVCSRTLAVCLSLVRREMSVGALSNS